MLVHWIWLATRPELTDREKIAVLRHFHDPEDAFYADEAVYAQIPEITPQMCQTLKDKDLSHSQEILQKCQDKRIQLLTYRDALYPNRLRNIQDPPLVLYYKGILPEFDDLPAIGVVGTRQATPYGMNLAKRIGAQIARCGGLVISGLATGIDAMSMRGALSAGKSVVGVMGCGVDVVYPAYNQSLLLDTQRCGCLISEFPPETPPYRWNFPKRNRIISGLSCGVLVVEAPAKSGALITANQAADQGRDVFVTPGNVDVAACAGSNALLREGAIAVSTGWDIMSEYEDLFPGKIRRDTSPVLQTLYPEEESVFRTAGASEGKVAQKPRLLQKDGSPSGRNDKKSIDNGQQETYIDLLKNESSLTPDEQAVLEQLKGGDCLVDELIAGSGLSSGAVLSALTLLEIKGLILRLPGRRVCLPGQKP